MKDSTYRQLHQLYYTTIILILDSFPESKFRIRWRSDNEFLYDVEIPQLNDIDKIFNILNIKQIKNNYSIVIEKLSLNAFLNKLSGTNQNQHQELYNNYFTYGKYFTKNRDEIYFVDKIENVFKLSKLDSFDRYLIDSINYSFYKFKEIKINCLNLIETDLKRTYSLDVDIYLANLFICIAGLIDNLKNSGYPIQESISQIEFNSYKRYKHNTFIDINSILELINHFRDAVCHREVRDNNITKHVTVGGKSILHISGEFFNCTIRYGDGKLKVNEQLTPLIKCIKELLIPKELSVISIVDKGGKVVFCDLENEDEDFPLQKGFYVSQKAENIFRIHFPIG